MSAIARLLKKNERLNRWQMICLYFALVIGLSTWGIMMILGFAFVLAGIIVAAFAAGGGGATQICPHCGAYVDAGEEYCPDCGGPLF